MRISNDLSPTLSKGEGLNNREAIPNRDGFSAINTVIFVYPTKVATTHEKIIRYCSSFFDFV